MDECVCNELEGQPVETLPHPALILQYVVCSADRNVETYRCRDCSAIWQRMAPVATPLGKPQVWGKISR